MELTVVVHMLAAIRDDRVVWVSTGSNDVKMSITG
jgi:hypothetical protein